MKPCRICNSPQDSGYIICGECAEKYAALQAELARVTAERDAAVEDIPHICELCIHKGVNQNCTYCQRSRIADPYKTTGDHFKWRGTDGEAR